MKTRETVVERVHGGDAFIDHRMQFVHERLDAGQRVTCDLDREEQVKRERDQIIEYEHERKQF